MSRRLSAAEKGKGIQRHESPPRRGRVQVPAFDNSELMRRHELTLIGRVTNPKVQRMWSLILFLSDHWKCSTRREGADLGKGKFHFLFKTQEDLQKVLDNRPYHFAHWMIIIEKWEPSISPSFPSNIPFWIQVHGVPVHLWNEAILHSIGKDLGIFDTWEITPTKARLRAQINGLFPLIFNTTLEFSNGDEVEASLLYEKLEKHCSLCHLLTHEKEDCPQNATLPRASSNINISASRPRDRTRNLPTPPSQRESSRNSYHSQRSDLRDVLMNRDLRRSYSYHHSDRTS